MFTIIVLPGCRNSRSVTFFVATGRERRRARPAGENVRAGNLVYKLPGHQGKLAGSLTHGNTTAQPKYSLSG